MNIKTDNKKFWKTIRPIFRINVKIQTELLSLRLTEVEAGKRIEFHKNFFLSSTLFLVSAFHGKSKLWEYRSFCR